MGWPAAAYLLCGYSEAGSSGVRAGANRRDAPVKRGQRRLPWFPVRGQIGSLFCVGRVRGPLRALWIAAEGLLARLLVNAVHKKVQGKTSEK